MVETPLRVGDVLHGFCGGAFGRDAYYDKRVEALGADWVVVRELSGVLENIPMLYWGSPEDLAGYRHPVCPDCGYQGPAGVDGTCDRCVSDLRAGSRG